MTLEQASYLTVILSAVAGGTFFLYREFKKTQKNYRKKFIGYWINSGDVILSKNNSHDLDLELKIDSDDGEITGTIDSKQLRSDSEAKMSVNGTLFYKSAILTISNVRMGEYAIYGKAKIKLKGKNLKWKLINGNRDFFPFRTLLWQHFKHYE